MRYPGETHSARLAAETALLLTLASVLGYAESALLPPLPVPGLRLGLANLAVVLAFLRLGRPRALLVSLGRVVVVGVATGTLFGPVGALSSGGALASWAVMALLTRAEGRFTAIGWSVAGSAAHVVAQLFIASALVGSAAVVSLAPFSLALSLPTGLAIGLSARTVISRVSRPVLSTAGV